MTILSGKINHGMLSGFPKMREKLIAVISPCTRDFPKKRLLSKAKGYSSKSHQKANPDKPLKPTKHRFRTPFHCQKNIIQGNPNPLSISNKKNTSQPKRPEWLDHCQSLWPRHGHPHTPRSSVGSWCDGLGLGGCYNQWDMNKNIQKP